MPCSITLLVNPMVLHRSGHLSSLGDMVIRIQSSIIIAPINIIIVFLFKSGRPGKRGSENYQVTDETQRLLDEITDTGCMLPHFFLYIGWFLCFCTTMVAATFTLFYSLIWGKETSEQWLASILFWGSLTHGKSEFFLCSTLVTRGKSSYSIPLPNSKLTIFLILFTKLLLSVFENYILMKLL